MNIAGRIKQGFYFDSVTLMRVGRELSGFPGVAEASVVMATEANKSILDMSGLLLPEFKKTGDQDLLIVVKAKDPKAAGEALAKAEEILSRKKKPAAGAAAAAPAPRDVASAVAALPGANLAMISVAGRYAAREARKALDQGLQLAGCRHAVVAGSDPALHQLGKTQRRADLRGGQALACSQPVDEGSVDRQPRQGLAQHLLARARRR